LCRGWETAPLQPHKPTTMKNANQQIEAYEVLVRNNHFCGGNIPFDKTSNYVGMLQETNAHRALFNAKPLK